MHIDFVICGEIHPNDLKPEGPFGDHLGYYSLIHDFPVLKVHKVFKENGICLLQLWVQPSTRGFSICFLLIHEISGSHRKRNSWIKIFNAVDELVFIHYYCGR